MPIHDKMSSSTCSKARSHLKPIPDSKFSRPGCAPAFRPVLATAIASSTTRRAILSAWSSMIAPRMTKSAIPTSTCTFSRSLMAPAASLARTGRPISLQDGLRHTLGSRPQNFRPHRAACAPLVLHLDVPSDASKKELSNDAAQPMLDLQHRWVAALAKANSRADVFEQLPPCVVGLPRRPLQHRCNRSSAPSRGVGCRSPGWWKLPESAFCQKDVACSRARAADNATVARKQSNSRHRVASVSQ